MADSGGIATQIYEYVEKNMAIANLTYPRKHERTPEQQQQYMQQLEEMLPLIKEHGLLKRGANKTPQIRFFHSNQEVGEEKSLDATILEAILSDCENTVDAIMHGEAHSYARWRSSR